MTHTSYSRHLFWILKDPVCASSNIVIAGRTLESEDMPVIFQKKVQKMLKKAKYGQNLGKNVQDFKIF